MSDPGDNVDQLTPADLRRTALLATINANNEARSRRPSNPYAHALGWIGGILIVTGLVLLSIGAVLAGGVLAVFGLATIVVLLTVQLVRWTPKGD